MDEIQTRLNDDQRTIQDFGAQWTRYQENEGYYGSKELFADICGPLLSAEAVQGKSVADIGSGTGRIVNMLLDSGAAKVVAVEPSVAFAVLKKNTEPRAAQITYLNVSGDKLPPNLALDYVFSIGVLHHISEPEKVVTAAYQSLKVSGKMLIWLYGYEGNAPYLRIMQPVRKITTRLPDSLLVGVCHLFNVALDVYLLLCRRFKLPLRAYINGVLAKLTRAQRRLIIYDQLNPRLAKYYTEAEARALLENAGFSHVELYHRYGYSWTVSGVKSN